MSDERERLGRVAHDAAAKHLLETEGLVVSSEAWDDDWSRESYCRMAEAVRAVLIPVGSVVVDGGRLARLVAVVRVAEEYGMESDIPNDVYDALFALQFGDLDEPAARGEGTGR